MCIAILNTKSKLPKSYIQNSWKNNNQGAGLLYIEKGILTTFKSYSLSDYMQKYYELRKLKHVSTIVLHFRIATSGYCDTGKNLHPFFVNKDLGFVHNGVISGLGNKEHSDTFQFNEMLKKLPKNFLTNDTIISFIENYIGWSKLIFLDSNNSYTIINELDGHWDKSGNWFSNDSYKSINDFKYYGNKKVQNKTISANNETSLDDFFARERLGKMLGINHASKDFDEELEYYRLESGLQETDEICNYLNQYFD